MPRPTFNTNASVQSSVVAVGPLSSCPSDQCSKSTENIDFSRQCQLRQPVLKCSSYRSRKEYRRSESASVVSGKLPTCAINSFSGDSYAASMSGSETSYPNVSRRHRPVSLHSNADEAFLNWSVDTIVRVFRA